MEKSFGENLQALMATKNLSGRELARALELPPKTVQEWIGSGARVPRRPEDLKRLAGFFKCSIHYLLFGVEDKHSMLGELLEKSEIHTGLYEISIKRVRTREGD